MSGKLDLKKTNILKRLSIPSISEIKYKELLLNSIKEKEPEISSTKTVIKEKILDHKSVKNNTKQSKDNKSKNDLHHLEIKIEQMENTQKLKDEEIINITNKFEEEKNKTKKLMDIIAKKDLKIELLTKSLDKYEKQDEGNHNKNNGSTPNQLIKIDIINKKVEYNLNLENNQLKEKLKLVKKENSTIKEELEKNKETIINLQNIIEKNKKALQKSLNEMQQEQEKKIGEINNINEKQINLLNEEITNLKNEISDLKEINEKYKNEIKEKENLINQLTEENNFYIKEKNDTEKKLLEINKIHEILQNELEDIKKFIKMKEDSNNEIINNLKEEAIEAKIKYANTNYENDVKYMKLKKQFDKLISTLHSFGIKVKEIKL